MTTAQESSNGHRLSPPPCLTENPPEPHHGDFPADKANHSPFASPDPVAERQTDAPVTPPFADSKAVPSDEPERGISSEPLPDRCEFAFSDGRQCRMPRSEVHPSLCRYHAEREEQLFGIPAPSGIVGPALDLPELHSACRDLSTAGGVNRALAQVFRLLAQRRISRQEAATFGHLAQLLLRTISLMGREDLPIQQGWSGSAAKGCPHGDETHGHREPSPVRNVESQELSAARPGENPRSETAQSNSRAINTCEITGDKVAQNEHLQKSRRGWASP